MNSHLRKYIGHVVTTECGDSVKVIAADYDTAYLYGYSDKQQQYLRISCEDNSIVGTITIDRLRNMAEEGRIYTD